MKYFGRHAVCRMSLVVLFAMALSGCSAYRIDQQNAAQLFEQFSSGNLRLGTGFLTAGTNILYLDQMYDNARRQEWAVLAKVVIEANSGDDVGYYYLGLAAQNLGYKAAARTYYELSIDVINRQTFPSICARVQGVYQNTFSAERCRGLELPQAAYVQLQKLK